MCAVDLGPILEQAQRQALLNALQQAPDCSLEQLCCYIRDGGPLAAAIGALTLGEIAISLVGEPPVDRDALGPDGEPRGPS